jgi:DNA primase
MKTEDFDILRFLQDRNIAYSYSGNNVSSGWIGINCVFCIDQSDHLGINLKSKAFSCFKCAEKGNAVKLIQEIDGVDTKTAFSIMNEYTEGYFVPREKHYQSKVKFPTGTTKNYSGQHLSFLENRRYEAQTVIKRYDLYFTGPLGDYKHRIIIPVFLKNRIVSFVGRDITGKSAIKYKNSSELYSIKDVKQCLYNMDSVIRDKAVIVEGIFDAWRIGDGAVATFGTKYTKEQLRLLKGLKQVFVMYDEDASAISEKLAYDLTAFVSQVEVLKLSEGDPDNLTAEDVVSLRKDLNL